MADVALFAPYFGAPPPWLALSARSMAGLPQTSFHLIGDQLPIFGYSNVRTHVMPFPTFVRRLERATNLTLSWPAPCHGVRCGHSRTNKVSDTRPFLGALFADVVARHTWWGWFDLDVVFGNLTAHMPTSPALCPMWPNPVSLTSWGPLTMFRVHALLSSRDGRVAPGWRVFELAADWRRALAAGTQQGFEELALSCSGRACSRGLSNVLDPRHCQHSRLPVAEVVACRARRSWGKCAPPVNSVRIEVTRHGVDLRADGRPVALLHMLTRKDEWPRELDGQRGCRVLTNVQRVSALEARACVHQATPAVVSTTP